MKNLLVLLALFGFTALMAQPNFNMNAVKWTQETKLPAKLKKGQEIEIKFSAKIVEGYHIYAANQPGKSVLPLVIDYDKSAVTPVGKIEDGGNLITQYDEIFKDNIAYFDGNATFTQKIKILNPKKPISGKCKYQLCNDEMCLPAIYEFSLE